MTVAMGVVLPKYYATHEAVKRLLAIGISLGIYAKKIREKSVFFVSAK